MILWLPCPICAEARDINHFRRDRQQTISYEIEQHPPPPAARSVAPFFLGILSKIAPRVVTISEKWGRFSGFACQQASTNSARSCTETTISGTVIIYRTVDEKAIMTCRRNHIQCPSLALHRHLHRFYAKLHAHTLRMKNITGNLYRFTKLRVSVCIYAINCCTHFPQLLGSTSTGFYQGVKRCICPVAKHAHQFRKRDLQPAHPQGFKTAFTK